MELINAISETGVLIVITGIFLYTYITDKKKYEERDKQYNESLRLLSESNNNIAELVRLLNTNSCNNDKLLREHDERAIGMNQALFEIRTLVDKKRGNKDAKQN